MYLFLYFTSFTFRTFVFVLFTPFSFATYQASFLQWKSLRKTPEDWEIILKKVTKGYGTGSHWNILIKAPPILVALFSGLLDWIIPIRDLVLKISFPCSSCLWLLTPSLPECLMEFCKASLTFESAHDPVMWPFKWTLSACTFTRCHLFVKNYFRKWNLEIWSKFAFDHIWQWKG